MFPGTIWPQVEKEVAVIDIDEKLTAGHGCVLVQYVPVRVAEVRE